MSGVLYDYYRLPPNLLGMQAGQPFETAQLIEDLRREHYTTSAPSNLRMKNHANVRDAYYSLRGLLPDFIRRWIQRMYLSDWKKLRFPRWPVDFTVDIAHEELLRDAMNATSIKRIPFIWFWPDGASSCLIMTHDVETPIGRDHLCSLMDLDESYGIKASAQLVPEGRYDLPPNYVEEIQGRGFECNVHDLNHDGRLFDDYDEFLRRAEKINRYVQSFGARGFRAAAMYRKQDWFHAFEFSYDMSVPNVAHLEPQRGGCCTVMPYFVGNILELPLTTTEDYSLFHILNDYSLDLWKKQVDLIVRRHGLISFIAHPDYLVESRPRLVFQSLLAYLRERVDREGIWAALPGAVDRWWRARSQMRLMPTAGGWEIAGPEKHRARVAYAILDETGDISYELQPTLPKT